MASDRRAMLPFLPTLATALAVGALSLLCRPAAVPEATPAGPALVLHADAEGLRPAYAPPRPAQPLSPGIAQPLPGVLAFGRLPPPAFPDRARSVAAVATARPAHLALQNAAAAQRRPCAGLPSARCTEARRGEAGPGPAGPLARGAAAPAAVSASGTPVRPDAPEADEGLLPARALPYAAAAADWARDIGRLGVGVGSRVGRQAAAVGGAVAELFASEN